MLVNGKDYRTVWLEGSTVKMIDQNKLPFKFEILSCHTCNETCAAIKNMVIRGAGAIGAAAGYAMAQAVLENPYEKDVIKARIRIESTRPTARNLFYAVEKVYKAFLISGKDPSTVVNAAELVADEDAASSRMIGHQGSNLIESGMKILTHCNAGWLAFVDHGTALSPVYRASDQGKKVFVYVDVTGPRRQGARLTAWELNQAGIEHVIIPDNAGAFLMSRGKVDLVITGADRIALNGDTANKIGTLEKAIAADYYNVPFYIAAPVSTFDSQCKQGADIEIEERSEDEVLYQKGLGKNGESNCILVSSPGSRAINPAFDITPAGLIRGFITEKGIIEPERSRIEKILQ